MEFQEILVWAFQRHLNPLSWYIRPVFLIVLVYFAYKRSWEGVIITFVFMMSSMVWFPAPETINPQMQEVLEYEQMLLSDPVSAILTIAVMMVSVGLILISFWKHSLKLGLIILNVSLIGKVILSLLFTGENGWGPLGTSIFGLILVNGVGAFIMYRKRKSNK
ncbi:hypothetical protein HP456_22760 [Bacillus haikouensis]|uniref:hypothetical protein n=1 Tax=Bacillus haikouensis TaxID=1510468 RepID=UPI0015562D8B|nr:hypothetical protein [Bacillus haikouensis]NQD68732.1 hypothetical protein [Bacillus haikouensis]